jgi:hypothetical protein
MRVARDHGHVTLTVSFLESRLLLRVLQTLADNYRLRPDQVDPKVAHVWYSTRGCVTAKMSDDETREWLDALFNFRGGRRRVLEDCARQLAVRREGRFLVRLRPDDAAELMKALNDHRLCLAAQHDIGQTEMDEPFFSKDAPLAPAQRAALFEIHYLAELIHEILRALAPEAAGWME